MAIDKSREIYTYVVQVWIQRRCKLTYTLKTDIIQLKYAKEVAYQGMDGTLGILFR